MDRIEQALIPLLAAAVLSQMLSTAPLRWEAVTVGFAPADPAAIVIPPPDPAPRRVAVVEADPYDCFCGAN